MRSAMFKYLTLYVVFVVSSALTLYVVEGIPIWKGLLLAGFGNGLKTVIVFLHGLFFKAPVVTDVPTPEVEMPEPDLTGMGI